MTPSTASSTLESAARDWSPSASNMTRLSCAVSAHSGTRVHQTAAGPFDDRDGLQRMGARLLAASEGQQPLQDLPALEVTAEVPEQAE